MPQCCGVESEKIVHPNGGISYHCPKCGQEWAPAVGLEFLNGYKTTITLGKTKKIVQKRRR